MKLKKIKTKRRSSKNSFWKKMKPITTGIFILLIGLIGYASSIASGKTSTNYWGGNILGPSVLGIFIGILFIIIGLIKIIE